jgi:hypothetical protein
MSDTPAVPGTTQPAKAIPKSAASALLGQGDKKNPGAFDSADWAKNLQKKGAKPGAAE